ncbi:MAG: hypothetical protein PHO37_03985 [Kiritimatiellae bacterium]|nr:hypothetical protein [Kiritimatiellia bacterium]
MYKNTISLRPDKPNFPLTPIWVGMGSAALFRVSGLPKIDGLTIRLILRPLISDDESIAIDGEVDDGAGRIYAASWYFPTAGQTKYEIIFFIPPANPGDDPVAYWCGSGQLNIMEAATEAYLPGPPPIIPPETYVRNPLTGLYHLVTAIQNDYGDITLSVAEEGIHHV